MLDRVCHAPRLERYIQLWTLCASVSMLNSHSQRRCGEIGEMKLDRGGGGDLPTMLI